MQALATRLQYYHIDAGKNIPHCNLDVGQKKGPETLKEFISSGNFNGQERVELQFSNVQVLQGIDSLAQWKVKYGPLLNFPS